MKKLLIAFLLVASVCIAQSPIETGKQYSGNQSCFVASQSATTASVDGVIVIASFTATPLQNPFGEFSSTTSTFTASRAYSRYLFIYKIQFAANVLGWRGAYLFLNGVLVTPSVVNISVTGAGQAQTASGMYFMSLNAGDTVTCRLATSGAGSLNIVGDQCIFQGYQLP